MTLRFDRVGQIGMSNRQYLPRRSLSPLSRIRKPQWTLDMHIDFVYIEIRALRVSLSHAINRQISRLPEC